MDTQDQSKKRTVRNLAIFTFLTISVGWLGIWLNAMMDNPRSQESLGMLLWLVTPLAVSLLLRAFAGDGWRDLGIKPAFKSNLGWYALSILVYPISILLILAVGGAFGAVSFPGFSSGRLGLFVQLVGVSFVAYFFKNILEEFAWRGYLTPKLKLLGVHDLVNHAIVGVIWAAWHLPYWIGLLDQATIESFTTLSLPVFILLSVVALVTSAILHGELKLATGSVWLPVLLHNVGNAVTLTLLLEGFIALEGSGAAIFTPAPGGVLGTVLFTLIGLGVYLQRTRAARRKVSF